MSKHPQTLTTDESERLLAELQNRQGSRRGERKGVRNYTMALMMLDAGLRVGEVVQLIQMDLWFNEEPVTALVVPAAIAKTRLQRIVPLTERLRSAIKAIYRLWWCRHDPMPHHCAFYSVARSAPLTTRQVERIIRAAGMAALGRPVHPHILRHTFASRLMRITNSRTVQQLLGHKQLSSTQIYTHPNADDLKMAITKMSDNSTPKL